MRKQLGVVLVLVSVVLAACGGKSGTTTASPTSPSTSTAPPPATNHNPVVTGVSVAPSFGVSELTPFAVSASATDPDGDALTYTWDIAGNPASGRTATITLSGSGVGTATVTVTDGRGGSASDSRTFTVGSMTGSWRGSGVMLGTFTMKLTQHGPVVTGTYADTFGSGQIDPAQPGSISSKGKVEMRVKQGPFTDWNFHGQMDSTGRRVTGTITGSGFNGQAFTMDKQ